MPPGDSYEIKSTLFEPKEKWYTARQKRIHNRKNTCKKTQTKCRICRRTYLKALSISGGQWPEDQDEVAYHTNYPARSGQKNSKQAIAKQSNRPYDICHGLRAPGSKVHHSGRALWHPTSRKRPGLAEGAIRSLKLGVCPRIRCITAQHRQATMARKHPQQLICRRQLKITGRSHQVRSHKYSTAHMARQSCTSPV